jgi:MFS family permease
MNTSKIAILTGLCALANIFCGPLTGKLTDRFGYKNIMIYDTVILFFVCLVYGYAGNFFAPETACVIVCINFLLDAIISTTSMATNLYVKDISSSPEEITSSLTTGISINHFISILAALAGGWIWEKFGYGILFSFAAAMAVANTLYAMTIPTPTKFNKTKGIQSC